MIHCKMNTIVRVLAFELQLTLFISEILLNKRNYRSAFLLTSRAKASVNLDRSLYVSFFVIFPIESIYFQIRVNFDEGKTIISGEQKLLILNMFYVKDIFYVVILTYIGKSITDLELTKMQKSLSLT